MELLNVLGIEKKHNENLVLNNISFTQQPFEKIAIAGETGSGKTSLLKIIAGLLQADAGTVFFEDKRIKGPDEKLIPGHKGIAYLSQQFELRNNYRVEEELDYTNQLTDEAAAIIYEVCRISHLLKRKTDQLSGGEKQRIAAARVLIASPKLLLLDEPFSNLDMAHKQMMKTVIHDIGETLKISCILISHDPLDTLSWADEIIVIRNGAIVQKASPQLIYSRPANEYVAALFGKYNLFTASQAAIFSMLPKIENEHKNLLIRPEHFSIASTENNALKGVVKKIDFFGSYYETEVLAENIFITVKMIACTVAVGDTVYLSIDADAVCYVD